MASGKPASLRVIVAPNVLDELAEIWRWNAREYSVSSADSYIGFVKRAIYGLSATYPQGRTVGMRPDLRYILIKRRSRGHGHIAVYSIGDETVQVLHIFHTAQDWQNRL